VPIDQAEIKAEWVLEYWSILVPIWVRWTGEGFDFPTALERLILYGKGSAGFPEAHWRIRDAYTQETIVAEALGL